MQKRDSRVAVIVAALNEERGIGPTIAEIKSVLPNPHLIVVDGNSDDKTVEIAKELGADVMLQNGIGKGDAILHGIRKLQPKARYVVFTDADYTYPAEFIPKMMEVLEHSPKVGMVIGDRFGDRKNFEASSSTIYHVGNRLIAEMQYILNGVRLRDPLSGLRVIRTELLRNWIPKSKGFDVEVEINTLVDREGYEIGEIPIHYRPRLGQKKLSPFNGIEILKRMLFLSFTEVLNKKTVNKIRSTIGEIKNELGMDLAVVGSGVVGQATGLGFVAHSRNVLFHDINETKLLNLNIKGHETTASVEEAVQNSEIVFVCVPTPTVGKKVDLSYLMVATRNIGKALRDAQNFPVIVFRSTVPPQTTRTQLVPLLERYSGLEAGRDFGVCMNPEFLREKSPLDDFLHPDRIVIGELDKKSGDILERVYSGFNRPIIRTSLDTAEMIKYASNLFLASKISFFNEIYMICQELGMDSTVVSETVSLDKRIGKYGVYGGKPFSGMCFPKDLAAFITFSKSKGVNPKLLEAVEEINAQIESFNTSSRKMNTRNRTTRNRKKVACRCLR